MLLRSCKTEDNNFRFLNVLFNPDLSPPSKTPTFTDYAAVVREPTSIEFSAGVDEDHIEEFHATLYAIDTPESHMVTSTTSLAHNIVIGPDLGLLAFGNVSENQPNVTRKNIHMITTLDQNWYK